MLLLGLLAEAQPAAVSAARAPDGARQTEQPVQPVQPASEPPRQQPQADAATAATSAAATPAVQTTPAAATPPADLSELWQQILSGLELPSTRMLLSQQAQLVRLDERKAVVRVAGTWMAMVQTRQPLVEQAITKALGSPRQLVLESGGDVTTVHAQPQPQTQPAAAATQPAAMAPAAKAAAPAAVPVPITPPAPAEAAHTTAPPTAVQASGPVASDAPRPQPSDLDTKAQRLAEFFNGEVVPFEGSLDGPDEPSSSGEAAA